MKKETLSYALLACTMLLSSCSKDEDVSIIIQNENPIVLNHEETIQIKATSTLPLTYISENEYNAKVSTYGLITANYVGETKIKLTNGSEEKIIYVEVEPKYNLYETPCLEWGISKSEVINKYGSPDAETSQGVGYKSYSSAAPILTFLFDNSQKLMASSVLVKTGHGSTLADFLLERYMPISVDIDKYNASFVDALTPEQTNTLINITPYNLAYLQVLYVRADTESNKTKLSDVNLNTHKELFNLMLK